MNISTFENFYYYVLDLFQEIGVHRMCIWLTTAIWIPFLAPLIQLILLYGMALIIFIYRYRKGIDPRRLTSLEKKNYYEGATHSLSKVFDTLGHIWHGYEVINLENIPLDGPALIISYHGTLPIDNYYLMSKCWLLRKRWIRIVTENSLFKYPGLKEMLNVIQAFPGSFEQCKSSLENGDLIAIMPGGMRECQFGDENYKLLWEKRIGFARLAIETKVPIIPVFTQNIREAFRNIKVGKNYLRKIYERRRIPVVPYYGGFPVKLRTIIGKPILFDPSIKAEELAMKTARAIEELIIKNQTIPGSITNALLDRI